MNRDKWIQQLHDKLAEHEVPAPEGLWADIEATLAEQAPLSSPDRETLRKSRHVALRRWAVAAAFAALMLGGGYLWWNQHEYKADVQNVQQLSEVMPVKEEVPTQDKSSEELAMASVPKSTIHITPVQAVEAVAITEEPLQETTPEEAVVMPPAETVVTEQPITEEKAVETKSQTSQTVTRELDRQMAILPAAKSERSLTLSLFAMNGFSNENNSNGVLMADAMVRQFEKTYENSYESSARLTEPIYLSGYEERQHHHRPVSYGLTVAYPFTKRLSLTTGIVYTKLVSDFTQVMHSQQIQQQQTLHYLGIPVSLSYRLWALKGFRAYVSAGTLTYWNVATHLVTEGVTQQLGKDRVQWAFNGSIGVQYDILPQLGLYAEPGLSYYPDNGSRLQNFFKDKPWNMSLQVGLRINFGRNE